MATNLAQKWEKNDTKMAQKEFIVDKEQMYQSIIDSIHLAIDSEQSEDGPHPYKEETERCLHVVYTLLREALDITEDPAS